MGRPATRLANARRCRQVELTDDCRRRCRTQRKRSPSADPRAAATSASFGLPFGWLPIVVSSLLFALAHFGYGPDPIPLFLLALILGYVYQRTHRIVPSIVTHALFNGMSLFALWRVMSAGVDRESEP